MNAIATIRQGSRILYLYSDGTMLPMIAGGDGNSPPQYVTGTPAHDAWHRANDSATGGEEVPELVELRGVSLSNLVGQTFIDATTGIAGTLVFRPNVGGSGRSYYYLQTPNQGAIRIGSGSILMDALRNTYSLSQTADSINSLQPRFDIVKTRATQDDLDRLFPGTGLDSTSAAESRDYMGELNASNAFAAAEAEKDRAFRAQQAEMDREIERQNQARQEREARLNALLDNIRYLNEIQPDLARFGAGLNSVPLQGITPTVGYGNALEGNIQTLQGQLQNPPPLGTPIPQTVAPSMAGTGMAMGGTIMPSAATMNIGTTKRGVLVGDREINGDEELLTMDPRTGEVEVIPIVGRAAEGATFNFSDFGMNPAEWDTSTLFGAMSPLYGQFGITEADQVRTRTNAGATDYGYIQPKFSTDFAPVQPPAYGALSQQYFDINRGMLLPNPSTIIPQLRALRANDPVGYANVLSLYETATNKEGKRSGLPAEAIEQMLANSALTGSSGTQLIGIR